MAPARRFKYPRAQKRGSMPRLPFWMRIGLGVLLGTAGLIPLWLFVGIGWLTATAAALLAAIGFLGSFFVFSADRPDEGYEQVLFDKPNTVVSVILLLAFAGAGVGTGFLGGDAEPSTPERVTMLYNAYQNNADAYARQEVDAANMTAILEELRVESDRLAAEIEALPEGDARAALAEANDALALAMDSMKLCVAGTDDECLNARLTAADAQTALQKHAAL